MNISAWAIHNPRPPVLLFIVLLVLGLYSFRTLPITSFPVINTPIVNITVVDPGSSPEEIETAITQRVEDSVVDIPGIGKLESTIEEGVSSTTVEFALNVPVDRAVADVRDAVMAVRADLPASVEEPLITRVRSELEPAATYAVIDRTMSVEDLSYFVDDVVLHKLRTYPEIGQIRHVGGVNREIQVQLDADRLAAFDLTVSEVNARLSGLEISTAGGSGQIDGLDRSFAIVRQTHTLDELRHLQIGLPGGGVIPLGELGKVMDTHEEPKLFATLNGVGVIAVSVFRADGGSDVAALEAAERAMTEIAGQYPNARFTLIDDDVTSTLGSYNAALSTLAEGALLTMAVVFLFLRSWRATLVAAVTLPLAAIPTFWVMDLLGFSLNVISLLGITLVAGILVDDAIVEIENISRHAQSGKPPVQAALDASDEIGLAVIAISSTIIAVFMPVGIMGGMVGQYFREFGLTVAIAVFFSLLVARLITPLMAACVMRVDDNPGHAPGLPGRVYGMVLRAAIRWRAVTMVTALVLFIGSLFAATRLSTEFLPPEDEGRVQMSIELPLGSTLADTRRTAVSITGMLSGIGEVDRIFIQGGIDAAGINEVRRSTVLVLLKPKAERVRSSFQIASGIAAMLRDVPDIRFEMLNSRGERDVTISVLARDGLAANTVAADILTDLNRSSFAVGAVAGNMQPRPELRIRPDQGRMADLGVTTASLADTFRISTVGAPREQLPEFIEGSRRIRIRLQLEADARQDLKTLENLGIRLPNAALVPLGHVADLSFGERLARIERLDRERRIDVGFDAAPGLTSGDGLAALNRLPSVGRLPEGVRIVASGDSDTQGEMFSGFATAMAAGMMLVLVVLILLFGSFLTPLTILATLPLSIGGVVTALMVTGTAVSMPVVIGILMLMGIVTKNGIMLVDFAVERERKGMTREAATIEAGLERARPIVMTTLAMVAGMIPAALGTGEGGEIRSPMAIAVIGGLILSTLLSLVVIPAMHCLLEDACRYGAGMVRRIQGRAPVRPTLPGRAD